MYLVRIHHYSKYFWLKLFPFDSTCYRVLGNTRILYDFSKFPDTQNHIFWYPMRNTSPKFIQTHVEVSLNRFILVVNDLDFPNMSTDLYKNTPDFFILNPSDTKYPNCFSGLFETFETTATKREEIIMIDMMLDYES